MGAEFSANPEALYAVDWSILQRCDFKRDGNDPDKLLRYQAEALVYGHVPSNALLGVACATGSAVHRAREQLPTGAEWANVEIRSKWFF